MATLALPALPEDIKDCQPIYETSCVVASLFPSVIIHSAPKKIPYLPISALQEAYPQSYTVLGQGVYGKVYETSNGYAVKVIKNDLISFLSELNVYASVSHPCLIKPLAWSYYANKYYLVLPKGEDLQQAYNAKRISLDDIMADSLSIIAFLNSIGLAHCDIKADNFVFLDGKAVLIDPGIASKTSLGYMDRHYITGISYSGWFRDPEYLAEEWNDVRSELYALGVTYYVLAHNGQAPPAGALYSLRTGNASVDHALEYIFTPLDERPTAHELLTSLAQIHGLRQWSGSSNCKITLPVDEPSHAKRSLCVWLAQIAILQDIHVETFFLGVNLLQRSLKLVLPAYQSDTKQSKQAQLLAAMCVRLASMILCRGDLSVDTWLDNMPATNFSFDDCQTMLLNIVNVLDGVLITPTYWDYASSAEDLSGLLEDTFSYYYDPTQIRELTVGDNKAITMGRLHSAHGYEPAAMHLERKIRFFGPVVQRPQRIYPNRDNKLRKLLTFNHCNLYTLIAKVIGARKSLKDLDRIRARELYQRLYNNREFCYEILDRICHFDWRKRGDRFLYYHDCHVFTVTEATLESIL